MNDAERIHELEMKIAFLEKHIGEQDRVVLGLTEKIALLETRMLSLRERLERGPEGSMPPDEKPPHY